MDLRTFTILLQIILFSATNLFGAQNNELTFEHLSIADGLSNSTVNCILKDSRGFMWFGTNDGLNKYDGYQFTVYKNSPANLRSINSYEVMAIMQDSDQTIWIATKRGGLDRYDRKTDVITNVVPAYDEQNIVESLYVLSILQDHTGKIWFGTEVGLYSLDKETRKFAKYLAADSDVHTLSSNTINCLFEDTKKRVWVGTADGLNVFDRETNTFKRIIYESDASIATDVRGIFEDAYGNLWMSVYFGGLMRLNPEKNSVQQYLHDKDRPGSISINQLFCIAGDKDGNLYIGTENGGLNTFNVQTEEVEQYLFDLNDENSINSNSIYSAYVSDDGIVWLGTYNGGINYSSKLTQGFRHFKVTQGALNNPYILSIANDKSGNLWIGTDGGGLNVFNKKTRQFQYYLHNDHDPMSLSANEVTSVFIDSYDQLWVGTYRASLDLFDPATERFIHFPHDPDNPSTIRHNFILTIFEDDDRNLFIGTFSGLDRYDRVTRTFSRFPYPIIQDGVLSMLEDGQGNYWVGTYSGLSFIDKKTGYVVNYVHDFNDELSAVPDICYALCEDSKGHIWIGAGKGLYRYDRYNQRFLRYQSGMDLTNNPITGIIEDHKGNLWLSAGQMIIRMENAVDLPITPNYTNFGVYEGLKGLFRAGDGEIYFSGNYGLNMLSPEDIIQNPVIPPVVMTNFKIFNKDVMIGEKDSPLQDHIAETSTLKLSHKQSVLTFEFAALNYIFPEKNHYAFIMDGFEKEWNYVGTQRSATYTNLDAGDYVFRVKGSNNDGIWNERGVAIRIKIVPPWWETNWAKFLYFLFLSLMLISIWRFQLNRARIKHELELEHLHAEKLEEINRMKSRFFSNVTHEFRTPLTLIMGPIQQIFAYDVAGKFKEQCNVIMRNSQKLYQLINQLLDLSKLEAGFMPLKARQENIIPLLKEYILLFSPLAERKQIELHFSVVNDPNNGSGFFDVYLDQEKFEIIISNLLTNAIKFTPEGGIVELSVRKHIQMQNTDYEKNRKDTQSGKKIMNSLPSISWSKQKDQPLESTDAEPSKKFVHGFIEIAVRDSGIGCPTECIDKLFDRFYEVKIDDMHRHEGTGIGLALTKELVELHSGVIFVESVYGKGSTFFVRFPLGTDHLNENEIIIEPVDYEHDDYFPATMSDEITDWQTVENVKTSSPRKKLPIVLIIEDNLDFRKYLCDCLGNDCQVIESNDGTQGLHLATEIIPDLIVSDVIMPGIDGFEVCRRIKTTESTSHIPVILLTAKASEESKIAGLETGADDYIIKPFEIKELKVRMKNLIEQRKQLRIRFNRIQGLKPEEIATTSVDEKFLHKALTILEQRMSDLDFSVEDFARDIALSRVQLHRKLRSLTGQSTSEFIRVVRLNRAAQLLKQNHESITQIAYLVGFNSSSYFSRSFCKHFGVSPSEYALQNRG